MPPIAPPVLELQGESDVRGIVIARRGRAVQGGFALPTGRVLCQRWRSERDGKGNEAEGRVFHAPPNVLHYGRPGTGPRLEEGMFFTIEPMINLGRPETKVLADDWTAVTRDKSLSAQFEHSIGVTGDGRRVCYREGWKRYLDDR